MLSCSMPRVTTHVMGRINTGDNGAFTFESTSEPFTGAGSLQGRLISGEGGAAT
jgi:hypothetical protein